MAKKRMAKKMAKKEDDQFVFVRPTIARLEKIVKGSHESGIVEDEEVVCVSKFVSPPATIGCEQRTTTSCGGDWVRIGISLTLPCYPEEIEDAYRFVDNWVSDKLRHEVELLKGTPKKEQKDSTGFVSCGASDSSSCMSIGYVNKSDDDVGDESDDDDNKSFGF